MCSFYEVLFWVRAEALVGGAVEAALLGSLGSLLRICITSIIPCFWLPAKAHATNQAVWLMLDLVLMLLSGKPQHAARAELLVLALHSYKLSSHAALRPVQGCMYIGTAFVHQHSVHGTGRRKMVHSKSRALSFGGSELLFKFFKAQLAANLQKSISSQGCIDHTHIITLRAAWTKSHGSSLGQAALHGVPNEHRAVKQCIGKNNVLEGAMH
eukprot:1161883-Pelagomonas_calceolata.AAC.2